MNRQLVFEYDNDRRLRRLESYHRLWALLQPLARYSRPAVSTYGHLEQLSVRLSEWCFEDGGLCLSEITRDSYFDVQQGLQLVLLKARDRKEAHKIEEPCNYYDFFDAATHNIRTQTLDAGRRFPPGRLCCGFPVGTFARLRSNSRRQSSIAHRSLKNGRQGEGCLSRRTNTVHMNFPIR